MAKYNCKICNFFTDRMSNMDRHKMSKKHINNTDLVTSSIKQELPEKLPELPEKLPEIPKKTSLICSFCNKEFRFKSGLSRHKNSRCKAKKNKINEDNDYKEQNKKLIEIIHGQSKIVGNNSEVAKRSMNIMTYALKHFEDAPLQLVT